MSISFHNSGDFKKTFDFLKRIAPNNIFSDLDTYGRLGVEALSSATPIDSGLAARSWGYRIIKSKTKPGIEWYNTNVEGGTPVVILIQYGHGTKNGGYVHGRDFINPAIKPVFDKIVADVWKKVTK